MKSISEVILNLFAGQAGLIQDLVDGASVLLVIFTECHTTTMLAPSLSNLTSHFSLLPFHSEK